MKDTCIKAVRAREIIDCRGLPTIEVTVELESGSCGTAMVPSGLSKSSYEVKEIRDGGSRYRGLGTRLAVYNVNEIIQPALVGKDVTHQREIDMLLIELDGTLDRSKLGSNAITGTSLAVVRAASSITNIPLYRYLNANAHVIPVPLFNLINGGKHGSGDLEVQEFIIIPFGAKDLSQALEIATEVSLNLRDLLVSRYGKYAVNLGDEGGFVPPMKGFREPLDIIVESVEKSGYSDLVGYGLDVAASHFYDRERANYTLAGSHFDRDKMIMIYKDLCKDYKILSIEDPLFEDDFEGWAILRKEIDIQWVGDDLFATNPRRLSKGIESGAANALLWKVNQVGTLTEALDVAEMAYRNGYAVQVSERSGETEDSILADFAVALNSGQIKTGAPVRGERTSKYNRLLRITEELGNEAVFAGINIKWGKI